MDHPAPAVSSQRALCSPFRPSAASSPLSNRVQDLKARTKLAVSGQFNALDLNKAPKFGFGCECHAAACVLVVSVCACLCAQVLACLRALLPCKVRASRGSSSGSRR